MNYFKSYLLKCLNCFLLVAVFCCVYLFLCGFSKDINPVKKTQTPAKSNTQKAIAQENIAQKNNTQESIAQENITQKSNIPKSNTKKNNTQKNNIKKNITQKSITNSKSDDEISVIMVGDILLHDGVEQSSKMKDGTYDFSHIFANTKEEIENADVAIVNQEVIIGGKDLKVTGYPSFNAPYEIADELCEVGFDVVLHATNHALDRGKKGIVNCLDYWEKNHPSMKIVGIYESKEDAADICVVEKNGVKIAILNYTYGTNGISLPKGMPYAVSLLSEEKVTSDLKKAEVECDFTIVCPHWGTEYSLDASKQQKKWAKIFADNGADLIIGTHPHVIEPIEMFESLDGRKIPVYYSIGNFVNFTGESGKGVGNRMVGGMAKVILSVEDNKSLYYDNNDSENVSVKKCSVIPLVCHVESKVNGVTTYYMKDYNQQLASRNEVGKRDGDFSYEYCNELVERIWGKKYIE